MTTYKISKDNWSTYQPFNSLHEAKGWTLVNLGYGYSIEISSDLQIEPVTPKQKLHNDIQFGSLLIDTFLLDNRLVEPEITPYESLELLNKFDNIQKLASLGDIISVKILLNDAAVDDRLFTQERKDKYMNLINNYK